MLICHSHVAFIFYIIISLTFTNRATADLPSCSRAKCSHCKVPFIAQMCPIACSGCHLTSQNFFTSESVDLASINKQQIKVPHAQQLPNLAGGNNHLLNVNNDQQRTNKNQRIRLPFIPTLNNQPTNNFNGQILQQQPYINEKLSQIQLGQVQQPPYQNSYQSQSSSLPSQNQFTPNQQHFSKTEPQPPFQQQSTNFYNNQNFQPQPSTGAFQFSNPFQPFLHQSIQSAQQNFASQSHFGPSQSEQTVYTLAPPTIPSSLQQIQSMPPPYPQQQQQNIAQRTVIEQTQLPLQGDQRPFYQPRPTAASNNGQPLLHAVPNVIDPLQRPNHPLHRETNGKYNNVESSLIPFDKNALTYEVRTQTITGKYGENGLKCPKQEWEPCVTKELANQRFQNCCSRLGDGCAQLCSYDQNLATIQLAVLTGRCPVAKVADLMVCASGYENATNCCQAFGVFEPGFEHCRPYCNPAAGLPNDGMIAEKYRCLQKLQQIQRCFYLTQRP